MRASLHSSETENLNITLQPLVWFSLSDRSSVSGSITLTAFMSCENRPDISASIGVKDQSYAYVNVRFYLTQILILPLILILMSPLKTRHYFVDVTGKADK